MVFSNSWQYFFQYQTKAKEKNNIEIQIDSEMIDVKKQILKKLIKSYFH